MIHTGGCHCGAIGLELHTDRTPERQKLGACQCSFCRKHNARAFSDPKSKAVIVAHDATRLQLYTFGLKTSEQVLCGHCGVYVAMILKDEGRTWSVINIDALDDWALFTNEPQQRDYSSETAEGRIKRRKANWMPTKLVDWPE